MKDQQMCLSRVYIPQEIDQAIGEIMFEENNKPGQSVSRNEVFVQMLALGLSVSPVKTIEESLTQQHASRQARAARKRKKHSHHLKDSQ